MPEYEHEETTAHYIPIEQLLSLNDSLWFILSGRQSDAQKHFPIVGQKLKWSKTKQFLHCFQNGGFAL